MAIHKDLIKRKLQFLNKHLSNIERMEFNESDMLQNPDIQDLVTFRLQQAIETCLDIASHILAHIPDGNKETAKDALIELGNLGIISKELATIMGSAADFRNRVVHGYNDFDYSLLFRDYQTDVKHLRQFGKEIFEYLERV